MAMYDWRKMSNEQREQGKLRRRALGHPKHSPPHWDLQGDCQYLITAACYEHAHIIGQSPERMTECETEILKVFRQFCAEIYAWCVLPNHYHVLLRTEHIKELRKELGKFHGRSSFQWNRDDLQKGRTVWFNCFDRPMKSERHFWVSLNYVHHNPVHHGYVERWQDWPWSSATEFLTEMGTQQAKQIWKKYPLFDYGKKWDL
jgi:putative transposase